ncbi:unnamed protein product [Thelazia callipaeda]|uniref:Nucleoporin_N domain-containing protein n=1 Tax=Thelazia callipaeda TaxID=103827 RepID=A0A0N5CV86_THECL|nr:unnamed protein product [Thelazia callipaeda]
MNSKVHIVSGALKSATNHVQQFISKICEDGDLYYKLKYDPYLPDKVTISGLAVEDYQSLKEIEMPEFFYNHLKPIPQELRDQLNNTQSICTMGILPEIGRAYMTIDADLYVWNYEDSSDLAYFDGICNTITKVAVAKPKNGVFQKHIHCLLIVTTTKDILLLAASFTHNQTVTDMSLPPIDCRQADMYLLPDPLFKIPMDDTNVSDIVATSSGRIFFTEAANLYELDYQDKGWFGRRCRKVNHSKSFISYLLPSVSLITGKEERLVRLCLDNTREILYSLSENGSIQVYDLQSDKNSIVKVASLNYAQIQALAAAECRSVDVSFFAGIVNINSIPSTQSRYLHIVATTRKGVRLYFSCFPPMPKGAYQMMPKSSILNSMENQRPSCLRLRHVRLPPGYGVSPISFQPLSIYDAFYAHEIGIMAGEAGIDTSSLSLFSSSHFPISDCLTETVMQIRMWNMVMMITKAVSTSSFLAAEADIPQDYLLSRYSLEKFIILTEKGIQIIEHRTPVETLREILLQFGPDSTQINHFIRLHGLVNVGDMILTILCTDCSANNAIKDSALRLFFTLSVEKSWSKRIISPQPMSSSNQWSLLGCDSISDISLKIRSPLLSSTPQQNKRLTCHARDSFHEENSVSNIEENSFSKEIQTSTPMSCRHDALFMHFSRIIGNMWMKPLCRLLSDNKIASIYNVDQLDSFLYQLKPFKKVIEDNGLIVNAQDFIQLMNGDSNPKSYSESSVTLQSERRSLLSLRELLSLTIEVLTLWRILCKHQFHVIATLLNIQVRNRLLTTSFCNIVLSNQEICTDLIASLVRLYLGDNATTSMLCNELRTFCPSLFSVDDANTTKATEMIEEARRLSPCPVQLEILQEAVKLLKTGVQKIDLPMICQLFYEVDYMEGIVELSLERAERDDPKSLALVAFRNYCGENGTVAQEALVRRKDAYKCITDTLDRLTDDQKNLSSEDLLDSSRNIIIEKVFKSKDELANVAIFNWLLDNDLSDIVLQSKSPFLEAFLHRRVEEGGSNRYLDLLWRFHERNGDHKKAADLLYHLAQKKTNAYDIQRRVEYLSQAVMCIQLIDPKGFKMDELHDLTLEIRDKLDVAQIQLATRDLVQTMPRTRETIAAKHDLESQLYTVQELFEQFAIPLDLPEIKLSLCFCSSAYDENAIESFYESIIDGELCSSNDQSVDVRIQRLGTKLAALAKKYSSVSKYYPVEAILSLLLNKGYAEGFPPSFLHFIELAVEIPFNALIDALSSQFRKSLLSHQTHFISLYLMQSTLYVVTKFVEDPSVYIHQQSKTAVASKCLDLIAGFLIHLSQPQSSTTLDQKMLIETFKSLQMMLEKI